MLYMGHLCQLTLILIFPILLCPQTHAVGARDPGAPQKITLDEENVRTGMMCSPQCNRTNAELEGTSESSSISSSDEFVQPNGGARGRSPSLHAPVSHIHTARKVRDWTLSVTKPIAIIEDSNLRRIPFFANSNLQIESFLGHGLTTSVECWTNWSLITRLN